MVATILKYITPYLIAALIGAAGCGYIVYTYKDGQVNTAKAEVKTLKSDLRSCQEANAVTLETLDQVKKDRANIAKSCELRLKAKDITLKRIRTIEGITDEEINSDNDPILCGLNGLCDKQGTD